MANYRERRRKKRGGECQGRAGKRRARIDYLVVGLRLFRVRVIKQVISHGYYYKIEEMASYRVTRAMIAPTVARY